jgi:type IV secretory pathway VirB6-like protein
MENNNAQIVKLDNNKMIETINSLNLKENEKQELIRQLISNDVELIKNAKQKLTDSGVAQSDISNFLGELAAMSKKGMYSTTTLEAKTGSGKITMQFKGGDTKLIIPVLVILGIVVIAALVIIFWK